MSIQHCFPNCRCFRFKTNRWSTNMCCSGAYAGTRLGIITSLFYSLNGLREGDGAILPKEKKKIRKALCPRC